MWTSRFIRFLIDPIMTHTSDSISYSHRWLDCRFFFLLRVTFSSFSVLYLILHNFTCMHSVVKHSSSRLYVFTLTIRERDSNVRVYLSFLRPLGFFFFTFFPFATRRIYLYEFGHLLLKGRQEEEKTYSDSIWYKSIVRKKVFCTCFLVSFDTFKVSTSLY